MLILCSVSLKQLMNHISPTGKQAQVLPTLTHREKQACQLHACHFDMVQSIAKVAVIANGTTDSRVSMMGP